MVLLEDLSTADPEVAARNVARGWDRYLTIREDDGSYRVVSYQVIDSVEDARRSVAPRQPRGRDTTHAASPWSSQPRRRR